MTEMEKCIESLVVIFHKYADRDGDKMTLTKKELKRLLKHELPSFLKGQRNPKVVDCILKDLDKNEDERLDFEEFHSLIARLSMLSLASAAVTELEKSMQSLLSIYNKYAVENEDKDEDGNIQTLTKKEMKKLLETELPGLLKDQKAPEVVDKILKDLDANKDDKLDFGEFLFFIAGISISFEKWYAQFPEKVQALMGKF